MFLGRLSYIESTDFCGNGILRVDLCKNFGKTSMILVIEGKFYIVLKIEILPSMTNSKHDNKANTVKNQLKVEILK